MQTVGTMLLLGWVATAVVMLLLWLVMLKTQNAGIVDVGWALGLAGLAVYYATASQGDPHRRLLVGVVGSLWGLRLALYLFFDRFWGRPEDGRYQALRHSWGRRANLYFLPFFQAQALLDVVLSLPFLVACVNPAPSLGVVEYFGAGLWMVAFGGEWLADRQLARFKADPASRGKTCRLGLWRYSRHPNYFFEWLHWCSFALIALGSPYGWLGLVSPLVMLYLLFRVTGIPATEAQAVRSRGDDYRAYQRTTSAFVPWFPRKENV